MKNKENGGEGVCRMKTQAIDNESFFLVAQDLTPHFAPHKNKGY
jgi:hypothetical protein